MVVYIEVSERDLQGKGPSSILSDGFLQFSIEKLPIVVKYFNISSKFFLSLFKLVLAATV